MKKVYAQGTGNHGEETIRFELKSTEAVMVVVNGEKQFWCSVQLAELVGENPYMREEYLLNIPNNALVTIIGPDFQISIHASMENWQWAKVGEEVKVDCTGNFNVQCRLGQR